MSVYDSPRNKSLIQFVCQSYSKNETMFTMPVTVKSAGKQAENTREPRMGRLTVFYLRAYFDPESLSIGIVKVN